MRRRRGKLLIVGIDGARADTMAAVSQRPDSALAALVRHGAWTFEASSAPLTTSGPAWASALTGSWVAKHGVRDNDFRAHRLDTYPHFMARLRRLGGGHRTASIVNWAPINRHLLAPGDVDVAEDYPSDAAVCARAAALLREDADLDALFVHFDEVDAWGHRAVYSSWSPLYWRAALRADRRLGLLGAAIAARPTRHEEAWLIVTTSDHGGRWFGHGADDEPNRRVHFVVAGDGAARGHLGPDVSIVDLAATSLHHLGIALDPAWELDGAVRGHAELAAAGARLASPLTGAGPG
jgi:hypothetical protein